MTLAIDGVVTQGGSSGGATLPGLTTTNSNVVILVYVWTQFCVVNAISDGAGLTWTQRAFFTDPAHNFEHIVCYYATSSSALSSDVITMGFDVGGGGYSAIAFGVSGANISAPFDTNSSLPNTGAPDPGTVSTTAANTMILGGFIDYYDTNPTPGSGYTSVAPSVTNFMVEYQVVSAPQTGFTVNQTVGAGNSLGYICDALQQASGGFIWQDLGQGQRDYLAGKPEIIGY